MDEAEVFSGLVLFYNTGDANDGYKRQFLSVAPKNQPLLLALVFHDYKESDNKTRGLMDYIGGMCKTVCENPEIIQLAFSIIKLDPFGGADAVVKIINKNGCKNSKSEEEFLKNIIRSLRQAKMEIAEQGKTENDESTRKYDFDFTNKEVFKKQYKQFFGNTPVRDYNNVCEFFDEDLKILKKFLIHASIPAIRLEKPFVAREVQSINKLLELVESDQFDTMVNSNARLLLPRVYDAFNNDVENFIANKAAVAEVEKILKTIDTVSE